MIMNRTLGKGIFLRKYQISQLSENFSAFLNLYTYPNCCEQYLSNNSGKFQYFLYNLNNCDKCANKNLVNIYILAQFIGELYWSNNSDKTRQSVKSLCERAPSLNTMDRCPWKWRVSISWPSWPLLTSCLKHLSVVTTVNVSRWLFLGRPNHGV